MLVATASKLSAIALPADVPSICLASLQAMIALATYGEERRSPRLYSKFAAMKEKEQVDPIPSKNGMLLIYTPAMITALIIRFLPMLSHSTAAIFVLGHFLKRDLEVLALHKYSGTMPSAQAKLIGTFYALYAAVISLYGVAPGTNNPAFLTLGYIMFAVGQLGNLYHHVLLAALRLSGGDDGVKTTKRYTPPQGGLFCFVAAPHYLFELIAWVGIACIAQQLNAFLILATMVAYLFARAKNTSDWYFEVFNDSEWGRHKKAIVPFVF